MLGMGRKLRSPIHLERHGKMAKKKKIFRRADLDGGEFSHGNQRYVDEMEEGVPRGLGLGRVNGSCKREKPSGRTDRPGDETESNKQGAISENLLF